MQGKYTIHGAFGHGRWVEKIQMASFVSPLGAPLGPEVGSACRDAMACELWDTSVAGWASEA